MLNSKIKFLIKQTIPPALKRFISRNNGCISWKGNFSNWDSALNKCSGYSQDEIIEKVYSATLKVIAGEGAYESDSVLYPTDKIDPNFYASFSYVSQKLHTFKIIDFGGALGSTYWQHRKFIHIDQIDSWNIIEQQSFVSKGNSIVNAAPILSFQASIESVKVNPDSTFFISSGCLQYLEKPYELIDEILAKEYKFIFIDRVPLSEDNLDHITIQTVKEPVYNASYPAWFFCESKILAKFLNHYKIVFNFQGKDSSNYPSVFKGYLFERV